MSALKEVTHPAPDNVINRGHTVRHLPCFGAQLLVVIDGKQFIATGEGTHADGTILIDNPGGARAVPQAFPVNPPLVEGSGYYSLETGEEFTYDPEKHRGNTAALAPYVMATGWSRFTDGAAIQEALAKHKSYVVPSITTLQAPGTTKGLQAGRQYAVPVREAGRGIVRYDLVFLRADGVLVRTHHLGHGAVGTFNDFSLTSHATSREMADYKMPEGTDYVLRLDPDPGGLDHGYGNGLSGDVKAKADEIEEETNKSIAEIIEYAEGQGWCSMFNQVLQEVGVDHKPIGDWFVTIKVEGSFEMNSVPSALDRAVEEWDSDFKKVDISGATMSGTWETVIRVNDVAEDDTDAIDADMIAEHLGQSCEVNTYDVLEWERVED